MICHFSTLLIFYFISQTVSSRACRPACWFQYDVFFFNKQTDLFTYMVQKIICIIKYINVLIKQKGNGELLQIR